MAEEGLAPPARAGRPEGREEDPVSYEMLQDLLRAERRSNKLMALPPRFWAQVREFLVGVTEAFRLEQAQDPFGRKVIRLTDEVKNAKHAAEAIWALRERKLSMLALAASRDRKHPEGITPDEADLYRRILADLEASRAKVFDGLLPASAAPAAPLAAPAAAPTPGPLQVPIAPLPATGGSLGTPLAPLPPSPAPSAAPPATPLAPGPLAPAVVPPDTQASADTVTIRALGDIPPFVGPDMQTYLLKAGDIATVPPSIANLLVRRNKAAVVDA